MIVLAFSANTSFADFPRVGRLLAGDRFLPEPFEHRGRRLVFSYGMLVLAALSAVLLVVFGGVTDRLIPLYAVGALLAFTMSQAGMVVHWRKAHVRGPRVWVNAFGATATGATVVLVVVSKFVEGAWFSLVAILGLMAVFAATRRNYERLDRAVLTEAPLELRTPLPTTAVVPVRRWDRMVARTLRWAIGIAPEVVAVQVLADDRPEDDLAARWHELVEAPAERAGLAPPRLVVLQSDYRALIHPLATYAKKLASEHPERQVAVIVPELVGHTWYRAPFPFDVATILHAESAPLRRAARGRRQRAVVPTGADGRPPLVRGGGQTEGSPPMGLLHPASKLGEVVAVRSAPAARRYLASVRIPGVGERRPIWDHVRRREPPRSGCSGRVHPRRGETQRPLIGSTASSNEIIVRGGDGRTWGP